MTIKALLVMVGLSELLFAKDDVKHTWSAFVFPDVPVYAYVVSALLAAVLACRAWAYWWVRTLVLFAGLVATSGVPYSMFPLVAGLAMLGRVSSLVILSAGAFGCLLERMAGLQGTALTVVRACLVGCTSVILVARWASRPQTGVRETSTLSGGNNKQLDRIQTDVYTIIQMLDRAERGQVRR